MAAPTSDDVGASYDAVAEQYAELFIDDVDNSAFAQEWLAHFARLATGQQGVVADLGCGPGHVVNHLTGLGLNVVGYDLSAGQIAQARRAFPSGQFDIGDLTAIDAPDESLGGIVSRYSLIHLHPGVLTGVFTEWTRALQPGAPVLISFFGALSPEAHGESFAHTVTAAYALCPTTIGQQLEAAGFVGIEIGTRPPPEGGRPFDQATVLARRPGR